MSRSIFRSLSSLLLATAAGCGAVDPSLTAPGNDDHAVAQPAATADTPASATTASDDRGEGEIAPPSDPGEVKPQLYLGPGTTTWSGGVVPVCYASDGNNQTLLTQMQQVLATQWGGVANISFTGWGACGTSAGAGGSVRLHFVHVGNAKDSGSTAFWGTGANTFNDMYIVDNDTTQHFLYEVVHEFGHALGFTHEQQRPDNFAPDGVTRIYCPDTTAGQSDKVSGGTYLTSYFDTQSVMSYCMGWSEALSPGDVAGAQNVYGRKRDITNGMNASNNAVSRSANNLDLFYAKPDGSIWTSYWFNGLGSAPWPSGPITNPGAAQSGTPIAAVSRSAGNIDIFYAGADGALHSAYWGGGNWGLVTLPGTSNMLAPGQQVAAVSSSPNQLDVFFAGKDHYVYQSHWSGLCNGTSVFCGWSNAARINNDNAVPLNAAVTAVQRLADQVDLFYVAGDGTVHTSYCAGFGKSGAGSCNAGNFSTANLPVAAGCTGTPGTKITSIARSSNNLDVFYGSTLGAVCTNFWTATGSWGASQIAPNYNANGGTLVATAMNASQIQLFYLTNLNGGGQLTQLTWHDPIRTLFGSSPGAWSAPNHITSGIGGSPLAGGALGAASRTAGNLDTVFPVYTVNLSTTKLDGIDTTWATTGSNWSTYEATTF